LQEFGGDPASKARAPEKEKKLPRVVVELPIAREKPLPERAREPSAPDIMTFFAPDVADPASEAAVEPEPASSWFRGLVQRVVLLFDRPDPVEPATRALGPSLVTAIDKLGLAPTQVLMGVRYVRSGRPMVFDEATGKLVINRSHPGVRVLAARSNEDPRARLLLVAAAVREINRVLEVVTDATERRVLLSLLRGGGV
jgi:hypothetical protein